MPRYHLATRLVSTLWLLLLVFTADAGERVALLIGNSQYDRPDMLLQNPQNDARALGDALGRLGFDVTVALNLDLLEMQTALEDFTETANNAEFALFFYAGHGVQISGENFLIGTGLGNPDADALYNSAMKMSVVRQALEDAGPDIGMMILDACRNNPFSDSGQFSPGLVRTRGGAGLLIAYATDPGNVAFDGVGENSVFTAALLDHLATPGLDVRLMLGRVRQQVLLETRGQQIPWVEEAVLGEHFFATAPAQSAPRDRATEDLALWRSISSKTDAAAFRRYLGAYPDGLFAEIARARIGFLTGSSGNTQMSGASSLDILASADLTRVSGALTALGLLSPGRDQTRAVAEDLAPALDGFRQQLADPGGLNLRMLYDEATQISMFMAATTLQRIRTDIVALRSVKRTLTIANDALAQIARLAADDAASLPVLRQARIDVEAIRLSRTQILRRLDSSRDYYDDVLQRATRFVPQDATLALIGSNKISRDLVRQLDQRFARDAELFLKHVFEADESRKGSYAWMTDLLPEN